MGIRPSGGTGPSRDRPALPPWKPLLVGLALATGLTGATIAGTPEPVRAQAVCSAPHSSPTLAQSGSLRTLPPLAGWIQASVFGSRSTEFFGADGERQSFIGDSEFLTSSLFLSGAIGLVEGVEIWSQVPFHRLSVDSDGAGSTSTGLGDVRIAARIGSELFAMDVPLALRLGAKFPGSDFPVDPTVLPLTEGQRDWEVGLEESGIPDDFMDLLKAEKK